ncbi:uncharacterized protein DUF3558 [Amycolatopsis cihanbeyliensis]|uniref:Uncharacterized protein DUF3558 n=1 Tax=Amycolatopsis cihanbeyliensis TaxID=1128664 RepID=A0A542DIE1_AMYCI|nr:uncharacterized protein DUF3558 [Amycolatopsis cihanbeyliensis]
MNDPLDLSRYQDNPCALLTDAQVTRFLGEPIEGTPKLDGPTGDGCTWSVRGGVGGGIFLDLPTISDTGLAGIYRQRGTSYQFFREMPNVEGYPAVAYGHADETDQGECAVAVGTSDDRTVELTAVLSERTVGKKDPCQAAHDTAVEVVQNIKGGR